MLTWQEHPEWRGRKNYEPTEPLEESRQHYATVWIQEEQRLVVGFADSPAQAFQILLKRFRELGQMYDQGFRLRHLEEAA